MAVRLREVAALAGVSPRSVSNVINGHRYISPLMRAKVEAAIAELGYQPNLLARSLRSGRTGVVGLLVPEIGMPYFGELAHEVVEQARHLGLRVRIDETGGERERELDLLDELPRSGQVDGILLSPCWLTCPELAAARVQQPVVLLGERALDAPVDHVGIDNVGAARAVTQHLLDGGRTRIAAVVEREHPRAPTSQLRLEGYRSALAAAGLAADPELVAPMPVYPHRDDGADAMGRLLDGPGRRPDAVFCFNDMVATGVLRELRTCGLRVPDDVAVVGFDDVDECRFTAPSLSTVAPDKAAIARRALEALAARVDGFDGPPQDIRVPYRLVIRDSSATPVSLTAESAPRVAGRAAPAARA